MATIGTMGRSKVKSISVILAIILILCMFTACAGTPTTKSTTPTTKSTTTQTTKPDADPTTTSTTTVQWMTDEISIMCNGPAMPEPNDTLTWMEQNLGYSINLMTLPDEDMKTKYNLLSASKALPDICVIPSYMGDVYNNFVKQKLIVDLEPLLKDAPNIFLWRTQKQIDALREADGIVYAINNMTSTVYDMMIIRQDWLEKYGLSAPTTLEEFENVCDKFVNEDPDGNNVKDTKGYTVIGIYGLSPLFQAFGSNPFGWVEKDGKIVSGATQPETLAAVKYLNSILNKGYIDKDFLTVSSEKQQELVSTQKTGFCYSELWYTHPDNTTYHMTEEANWIGIMPPKGPEGKFGYLTSSNPELRAYTCIAANSKDPAAAMAYINFIADKINYYRLRMGTEGVHYELDKDGVAKNLGKYAEDVTLFTTEGISYAYPYPFMLEDPPSIAVVKKNADALKIRRSIEASSYSKWYWPIDNPMQIAAGWDGEFMEKLNGLIVDGGDFDATWADMIDSAYNKYKLGDLEQLVTEAYKAKYGN